MQTASTAVDVLPLSPPKKRGNRSGTSTSHIWSKFVRDGTYGICTICKNKLSVTKSSATSTLWRHLRAVHSAVAQEVEIAEREEAVQKNSKSVASTTTAKCTMFERRALSAKKQDSINQDLAYLMADCGLSFNILSSPGFINFVYSLNSSYKLPCRQTFVSKILKAAVADVISDITPSLATNHISLTVDEWASKNGNVSLFAVTGHVIDANFHRKNFILAATSLFGLTHDADQYKSLIMDTLKKYNVDPDRLFAITSDGASVMKKLKRDLLITEQSLHCYAHVLHLIVMDSFRDFPVIHESLSKMKTLVKKLNQSCKARSFFKRCLEDAGLKIRLPASPVPTRWNSTYQMMHDLLEMRSVADKAFAEFDLPELTRSDWESVRHITKALSIVYQQTQKVCQENACSSEYLVLSLLLREELRSIISEDGGISREFGEILLEQAESRFSDDAKNPALQTAMFLDPRFCYSILLIPNSAWKEIEESVLEYYDTYFSTDLIPSSLSDGTSKQTDDAAHLPSVFRLLQSRQQGASAPHGTSLDRQDEVRRFVLDCQTTRPSYSSCPLEWWRSNRLKYPSLSKLARLFLAVPATSVDSERLFSAAGLLYGNKLRNRLDGSRAEELLLLKLRPLQGKARTLKADDRRRTALYKSHYRYGIASSFEHDAVENAAEGDENVEESDWESDVDIEL